MVFFASSYDDGVKLISLDEKKKSRLHYPIIIMHNVYMYTQHTSHDIYR